MITLSAVFLPMPGALDIILESPVMIAKRRSSAVPTLRRARPPLGPIPLTVIRSLKSSRSSLDINPYSAIWSSLKYV